MTINGADRVNHESRRQKSPARDDGLACRESFGMFVATNLKTLFEYLRAARAVNRAVNAAPALERRVGRIDYRVPRLARDVADEDADAPAEEVCLCLLGQRRLRSEERRVGKEWRSRGSPEEEKEKRMSVV